MKGNSENPLVLHLRGMLLVFGLVVSCGACRDRAAPTGPPKPNVLLVVIDTLRADHLNQYGYGLPTCTSLDAFAGASTQFLDAYAVSPRTGPSTASLFTGLAPGTHGITRTGDKLAPEFDTLAERLRRAGWETIGFSHNVVISDRTGFGQGFDEFRDYKGRLRAYPDVSEMVAGAGGWLDRRAGGAFFMYLHAMNVHGPYTVPEPSAHELLGRPPREGFEFYGPLMVQLMDHKQLEMRDEVTPEILASLGEQYDTAVRYTCDQISLVLDKLRSEGIYDETLVVFASDHGEELFDHGGFGHGYTLYREVLHVPLWIKLPQQTRGRTVDAPVSLMDITPTLLDLLGLEPTADLHGRSIAGYLREGPTDSRPRPLYFQEGAKRMSGRALLTDEYKLVRIERDYQHPEPLSQLFDVRSDPFEKQDVAGLHPDVVEELGRRLKALAERYHAQDAADSNNVLDELDLEALRSLGYVE